MSTPLICRWIICVIPALVTNHPSIIYHNKWDFFNQAIFLESRQMIWWRQRHCCLQLVDDFITSLTIWRIFFAQRCRLLHFSYELCIEWKSLWPLAYLHQTLFNYRLTRRHIIIWSHIIVMGGTSCQKNWKKIEFGDIECPDIDVLEFSLHRLRTRHIPFLEIYFFSNSIFIPNSDRLHRLCYKTVLQYSNL